MTLMTIPQDGYTNPTFDHGTCVHHLLGQYDGPVVQNMGKSNSQLLGTHQTLGCHHQMMKETCPKMGGNVAPIHNLLRKICWQTLDLGKPTWYATDGNLCNSFLLEPANTWTWIGTIKPWGGDQQPQEWCYISKNWLSTKRDPHSRI